MACSTRPAVRQYLNFIEGILPEGHGYITQDEWHKISNLANPDGPSKGKAGDNWRVVGVAVFDGTPVNFPIAKAYSSPAEAAIAAGDGIDELSDGDWLVDDLSDLTSAQGDQNSYLEDVQVRKMNDAEYAAALLDSSLLRDQLDNEWEPEGDYLSERYVDLVNSVKENPPTQGTVNAIEYLAVNGVQSTLDQIRDQEMLQWYEKEKKRRVAQEDIAHCSGCFKRHDPEKCPHKGVVDREPKDNFDPFDPSHGAPLDGEDRS